MSNKQIGMVCVIGLTMCCIFRHILEKIGNAFTYIFEKFYMEVFSLIPCNQTDV